LTALKSHEDCTDFVKLLEPHFEAYSKTIVTPTPSC
jgi:hypothetical protein